MKLTQEKLVLTFLATGGRFNSRKARSIGIRNPSAVVNNLRNKGYPVFSNRRKTGPVKTFWSLSLEGDKTLHAIRSEFAESMGLV